MTRNCWSRLYDGKIGTALSRGAIRATRRCSARIPSSIHVASNSTVSLDMPFAAGTSTEVTDFTPLAMTSGGDDVMVVISYGARSRATGREVTMNIHHWWRFRDGKVALYRGSEDTAAVAAIFS